MGREESSLVIEPVVDSDFMVTPFIKDIVKNVTTVT